MIYYVVCQNIQLHYSVLSAMNGLIWALRIVEIQESLHVMWIEQYPFTNGYYLVLVILVIFGIGNISVNSL